MSTLDITGIISKPKVYSYTSSLVQTKQVSFSTSDCKIYPREKGFVYLDVNGLEPYGSPGEPMLPMKTFNFKLPKNSEIVNIGLENYLDSRLGLKFKFLMKFPKIIFGRRGLVPGLILSPDIDLIPLSEPIDFNTLLS